jgi:hypothetical protein
MTAELDIYEMANSLVQDYGPERAPLIAAKRITAMLKLGDVAGYGMWTAVFRAVQELTRTEGGRGDWVN